MGSGLPPWHQHYLIPSSKKNIIWSHVQEAYVKPSLDSDEDGLATIDGSVALTAEYDRTSAYSIPCQGDVKWERRWPPPPPTAATTPRSATSSPLSWVFFNNLLCNVEHVKYMSSLSNFSQTFCPICQTLSNSFFNKKPRLGGDPAGNPLTPMPILAPARPQAAILCAP